MNDKEIKDIIEKILIEKYKDKALVLFMDRPKEDPYSEEIANLLLKDENYNYRYIDLEDNLYGKWLEMESCKEEDIFSLIDEVDLIIIPFLTMNNMAKISLGIADTKELEYIQSILLKNKRLIVLDTIFNTKLDHNRINNLDRNKNYNGLLERHRNQMEMLGVEIVSIFDLEERLSGSMEKVIEEKSDEESVYLTLEDIEGKKEIFLSEGQIITDLAQEYIEKYEIEVKKELKS